MERPVAFDACFDTLQLPSIAGGNVLHLHALQRYITPIVHAELEKVFGDAANGKQSASASASERTKKSKKLMHFQDALQDKKQRSAARSNLLARVLSHSLEPSAAQCISLVENAAFSCTHTLLASQLHTTALFFAHNQRSMSISSDTAPLTFLHSVYLAASDAVYAQPFLFLRDVRAPEYVAKRQQVVALIDDLVEAKLYDMCAASIAALRTNMRAKVSGKTKKELRSNYSSGGAAVVTTNILAASQSLTSHSKAASPTSSVSHSQKSNGTFKHDIAVIKSGSLSAKNPRVGVTGDKNEQSAHRSAPPQTEDNDDNKKDINQSECQSSAHLLNISLPADCKFDVLRSLSAGADTSTAQSSRRSSVSGKHDDIEPPIVQLVE